ncbi:hypothetical protein LTR33_016505 [Friedmanniomyces endolithicus]|nr:hypothetical protein LTR33_016505 [Friedmanniomyces endolithicus]
MSKQNDPPDMNHLSIDDDPDENVFASPESGATTQKQTPTSTASSARKEQQRLRAQPEAREAQLRAELERVQEVSRVIEGVTASLEKATANMGTVQRTVESASTLLGTWTRILSQTEHNQRLILNPNWQGATQDLEDAENEDLRKHQDAERRVLEEQRRKEEAQRKAEEEERRRAVATPTGGRGTKTRGTRGTSSTGRGYTGVGGQVGRGRGTTGAMGSGVGRGSTSGRGGGLGNVTTSQAYGPFGSTFEVQRRPLTYAITQADPRRTQPSKRFAGGLRRVPLKFVQTTHEQLNERYAARG